MTSESDVQRDIQIEAPKVGARLLRNNIGAYQDDTGRWVHYGVGGKGGSDLLGWTQIKVTPEMVGSTIAVMTACEVKGPEWRPPKSGKQFERWKLQKQFVAAINQAGGIATVASSVDDLTRAIHGYQPPRK